MTWCVVGALLLALAVLVGAFGAHALKARLDAYATTIYERAVFYHFVHALGLLVIGVAIGAKLVSPVTANVAGGLLLAGTLIFSGSLYALALTKIRVLGAITPLGGIAFVSGWFAFAYACIRTPAP